MRDPTIATTASSQEMAGSSRPVWVKALAWLIGPVSSGRLVIELPSGAHCEFVGNAEGERVSVRMHRWRALLRFAFGGDTALAESYRDGDWATDDLAALMRWGVDNFSVPGGVSDGLLPSRTLGWVRHALRANSLRNSRRNIQAHYDLGNDFYATWLDEGMSYSSALYTAAGMSLEDAQNAKLGRVVQLLAPAGRDRVLEIGCGWGALAERLTEAHDCTLTGLTLSQEQHDYTTHRLKARDLSARADIRLQDYRDVTGTYDRIASIEMLEAVGERYWPVYFSKLAETLKPDGLVVLQVITIAPERYSAYRARPDFIQRLIFPGGMLPTMAIITDMAGNAGFTVAHQESFGVSYAKTLAAWRHRFADSDHKLQMLGYHERFRRLWTFYLAYCEAGFDRGWLDVNLIVLKPAAST